MCERVLQERDGVLSFIRVIDRVTHTVPFDRSSPEEEFTYTVFVAATWISGDAKGRHEVSFTLERHDGLVTDFGPTFDIHFEGANRGPGVVFQSELTLKHEGLHWLAVRLDKETQTFMPLEVLYQRQPKSS